jgi:hypothetical protein
MIQEKMYKFTGADLKNIFDYHNALMAVKMLEATISGLTGEKFADHMRGFGDEIVEYSKKVSEKNE